MPIGFKVSKETYKFSVWWEGKLILFGVTTDPIRRECDMQERFPGARLQIIGRKTTLQKALQWEDRQERRLRRKNEATHGS